MKLSSVSISFITLLVIAAGVDQSSLTNGDAAGRILYTQGLRPPLLDDFNEALDGILAATQDLPGIAKLVRWRIQNADDPIRKRGYLSVDGIYGAFLSQYRIATSSVDDADDQIV